MLAAIDLVLIQSVSMSIGIQRQTEMNPITIAFAGIDGSMVGHLECNARIQGSFIPHVGVR